LYDIAQSSIFPLTDAAADLARRRAQLRFHDCHPIYYRRRSATALDAPERILTCLPMALMLPIEGTETLARRRFVGSYQALNRASST
jgi:hypothetical protein